MVTTPDSSQIPARQAEEAAQASRDVIEKAFRLLEAWCHRSEILGGSEVARRSGLANTTAYRLLGILDSAAVIERVAGGYRIGDRLRGFTGLLAPSHRPELREATLPFLQDLYVLTHETVHLAVLDGADVRCVEKLHGHRRSPLVSSVGGALPADSTALGKILLAYSPAATQRRVLTKALDGNPAATVTQPLRLNAELRTILRNGVAFDRQGTHPDVSCVAAPVLSSDNAVVAAISISGPSERFEPAAVVDRLRRAARGASLALTAVGLQAGAA